MRVTALLLAAAVLLVVLLAGCGPIAEPQEFRAVSDGRLVSGWPCLNGYNTDGTVWIAPNDGSGKAVLCR